jgi:hypothetical protein
VRTNHRGLGFCKSMFGRNGFGWGKSGGLDGFLVVLVRCCDGLCCGWDAGAYKKDCEIFGALLRPKRSTLTLNISHLSNSDFHVLRLHITFLLSPSAWSGFLIGAAVSPSRRQSFLLWAKGSPCYLRNIDESAIYDVKGGTRGIFPLSMILT